MIQMDSSYSVYILEIPDNKIYIGCTRMELEKRWLNGNGYKNNKNLFTAIQKYGWENVKKTVYASDLSAPQAKKLEIELIKRYQANRPEHGYNRSKGGEMHKPLQKCSPIFSNKIIYLRKKNKLTQVELAELTHITQPALQAYEAGKAKPLTNTAIQLAKVLGVDVEDLMNDERNVE